MSVYRTLPQDASQLPGGLPDNFGYAGCYTYVQPWVTILHRTLTDRTFTSGTFTIEFPGFTGPSVTAQSCIAYCTNVYGGNAIAATQGESCGKCCFAPACIPRRLTVSRMRSGSFGADDRIVHSMHRIMHVSTDRGLRRTDNVFGVSAGSGAYTFSFPSWSAYQKLCS